MTSDGSYCLQVLASALWYGTNDHVTINEASKKAKEVTLIAKWFEGYIRYNEIKREKVKAMPLSSDSLHLHA